MLGTGINGFTENEILIHCRLSSGRNYPNELERLLNIELERIDEPKPQGEITFYQEKAVRLFLIVILGAVVYLMLLSM